MSETGLLAHLRDHFHVPPENLATEALAYILNSSERANMAWNKLCQRAHPNLPKITSFKTQVTSGDGAGIPDLVGFSEVDGLTFIGEVKFDAGLTSNQPVGYLGSLLNLGNPSLLLFIVPERRLSMVWGEVHHRCHTAEVELRSDVSDAPGFMVARNGEVTLGLVTWGEVLNVLEDSLRGDQDRRTLWDLRQLRAMCDVQEQQAFVPVADHELQTRVGRRFRELISLVYELSEDILVADGTVHLEGLARASSGSYIGRYMSIAGWQCLLSLNWGYWAELRATPIWLELNDWQSRGYTPLSEALSPLLVGSPPKLLTIDGWKRLLPVYVPTGVGRDELKTEMAFQIREFATLVQKAPKSGKQPTSALQDV